MKVMCIDDTHWFRPGLPCPEFGEVVTVCAAFTSPYNGEDVYAFVEYPLILGLKFRTFSQKYFAPLSDIDETELVNEKIEVHV